MLARVLCAIFSTCLASVALGEVCDGIPTRPRDPVVIQIPCQSNSWQMKEYSGRFAFCLPDDLVEAPPGVSNSEIAAVFERDDLLITIDFSRYADDLMAYRNSPDYREWSSVWWEPTWTKFVAFTDVEDFERPYKIASFVPNIDGNLRLNVFAQAKNCDGLRLARDVLRSVSVNRAGSSN